MIFKKNHIDEILKEVDGYYTEKILTHGVTPAGVDWNGEKGQHLRFKQLLKILPNKENFTLCDMGCGYGDLLPFLTKNDYKNYFYTGIDISEEMIKQSNQLHHDQKNAEFLVGSICPKEVDYSIASGIFNVKLDRSNEEWESYILDTLNHMNLSSKKGFSFNYLTSYSDEPFMKSHLYYADPCYYFDYCKRTFSKNVALLHDYDLYEFTLLVRKQ